MGVRTVTAVGLGLLATGCGSSAYGFLRDKTGVEVSRDVRLCTNGTFGNDSTCRPTDTGGPSSVRAENFDIHAISVADPTGAITLQEIQHRYLGTPYWGGHLQLACRREVNVEEFSSEITVASDDIDLGQALKEVSTRTFEADVFGRLPGIVSPAARIDFHMRLMTLIDSKILVHLRWFVARFTGGRYAMSRHATLNDCRNEVETHARDDAKMVTGVAGFAILTNVADTSITDRQNLEAVLGAVVTDPAKLFDDGAGAEWSKTVRRVLRVDATTRQLTPTIYPLWVQFEFNLRLVFELDRGRSRGLPG